VDLRADDQTGKIARMFSGASVARMTWMMLRTIPPIAFSALRA
jgi:hypothetical protein